MTTGRGFGVTEPISLAMPTTEDLKLTQDLEKTLRDFNLYETEEERDTKNVCTVKMYFGVALRMYKAVAAQPQQNNAEINRFRHNPDAFSQK
jgi:poly(A) polymerase Pap1